MTSFRTFSGFAVLLLATCLVGCTATAPSVSSGSSSTATTGTVSSTTASAGSVQTLDCSNPIGHASSSVDLVDGTETLSVVALGFKVGQIVSLDEAFGEQGFRFAKVGLAVHTGLTFELSVRADWQDRARIGWNNSGNTPTRTEKFPGCKPGAPGAEWVVFPGGFWVKAPACIPLVVTISTETITVPVPIGKACDPGDAL
ncbi:hypothetical protein FHU41_001543 [Psychromicrobium silvestre]|uniref:Uncharacterized protein n=1 Tax=Psychromicrobium silvestre TaxID=1645614 RepID=A0A7Y9LTJ3_9MICC|nr:hypothetical protein [Psychromicrobium silvestre]NYE95322.1 hypothetical protein [Psychromicrobium silvestre]